MEGLVNADAAVPQNVHGCRDPTVSDVNICVLGMPLDTTSRGERNSVPGHGLVLGVKRAYAA
jgi:hypothetical protein